MSYVRSNTALGEDPKLTEVQALPIDRQIHLELHREELRAAQRAGRWGAFSAVVSLTALAVTLGWWKVRKR